MMFLVSGVGITILYYDIQQSAAQQWQNTTSWGYSMCVNQTYAQISNAILQQGYILWSLQANNKTYDMVLMAQNITERMG